MGKEKERDNEDPRAFIRPGDTVTLRQEIPNRPVMVVVGKELKYFGSAGDEARLKGLRCRWFTSDGAVQEAVYSTKDLTLLSRGSEDND